MGLLTINTPYSRPMGTVSAHDVAAAIRERLPGVPKVKLHKLLYLAQGFHLAQIGEPLFREDVEAWKHGPVVAVLWQDERYTADPRDPEPMDNRQLNTVGYVCSRYGRNSGGDLEAMTHDHTAWTEAYWRRVDPGGRHTIATAAIRDQFLAVLKADEDEREFKVDPTQLEEFMAVARQRMDSGDHGTVDTRESLLARLVELRG